MKRSILAAAAVALLAFPAHARSGGEGNNTGCQGRGNPNSPCQPSTGNPVTNNVTNNNAARANASARAQANAVARGGNARATGGRGGNARVENNVTVQQGAGSGYTYNETRQAPGLALGFMQPPQCGVSFSAGGSQVNGTGALGFSWETESCRLHRLAALAMQQGRPGTSVSLTCRLDEYREAALAAGEPCPQDQPAMQAPAMQVREVIGGGSRPAYCRPGIANSECN